MRHGERAEALQEAHLRQELAHQPAVRERPQLVPRGRAGGQGHPDVEGPQGSGDDGEHVGPGGEEAAEADVDHRPVVAGQPRLDLGVRRLLPHGRPEEGGCRQERGALRLVELLRVVEQQQVAGLGERVGARHGLRVELGERGVPLRGERVADVDAQCAQRREGVRVGREARRPGGWVPVDLVAHRERGGVPEDDVGVWDAAADQSQPGAEREVVDEDGVGAHRVDEVVHLPADADRVPQQVVAARAGLELQRRDRAPPGGVEEPPQRVVLPRRLLLRADDAGVRAAAELQVDALVAEGPHHRVGGGTGGDDDALAGVAPRRGQGRQGVEVGRVVRADDEQGHGVAAIRPGSPWADATST